MDYGNFLMNLYFGSLDAELFDSFEQFQAAESTRKIIQNYLEVNSEYPASVLEENGICANGSGQARVYGSLCCGNSLGRCKNWQGYAQNGAEGQFDGIHSVHRRKGAEGKSAGAAR